MFNQGDEPATYTVELVDRVMLPDGQIAAAADHPGVPLASAAALVQHTPRRVTLQPRESQAIRLRARPAGDGSPERRTHLTVTALPPSMLAYSSAPETLRPRRLTWCRRAGDIARDQGSGTGEAAESPRRFSDRISRSGVVRMEP